MRDYLTVTELAKCVGVSTQDIENRNQTDLAPFLETFSSEPVFNIAVLQLFPKPSSHSWSEVIKNIQQTRQPV